MKYNMLIIITVFISITPVNSSHTEDTCQKKISPGKVTGLAASIFISDNDNNEIVSTPDNLKDSVISEEENKKLMQDFNTVPDLQAGKTINGVTVTLSFNPLKTDSIIQVAQLSEEENKKLMQDFNALPDTWLSREENEKLMWDFNALPHTWLSREENEKLMWDFNALLDTCLDREENENRDFNAMPYLSLSDEDNDFKVVPENMLIKKGSDYWAMSGTIEGHVYLIDISGLNSQKIGAVKSEAATCLPAEGILVNAWSDKLNTGNYAVTDKAGYYKIPGLKNVAADEAELRGYFVEIQADDYPYQVFDQTDIHKEGIKVETGASDIDFYLETNFTI